MNHKISAAISASVSLLILTGCSGLNSFESARITDCENAIYEQSAYGRSSEIIFESRYESTGSDTGIVSGTWHYEGIDDKYEFQCSVSGLDVQIDLNTEGDY